MSLFIISAILSLFFSIWFILKKLYIALIPAPSKNLPPSPRKLPILGNLHQLGSLPHQSLHTLAKKHGPLMLLHFGNTPTLIASSAELAQEIMKNHDLAFSDRPQSTVSRRLMYDCKDVAFALYGKYWRQLKSICVLQLLSNRRVHSFHSIRAEETSLLIDKIEESPSGLVNLGDMFTELTNDVVCRSAFGKKYRDGETGKKFLSLLHEFVELIGTFSVGDYIPWLWWVNQVNGFDARVEKVSRELDDFFESLIRERMETPVDQAANDKNVNNFLDILLDIYQNNSTAVSIDRDSIKAIILDVFAGGTDTTSTVLEWAMAELIRHPTIMKKLQLEVREIVKERHEISNNDLENMHYLKAVIKETLRCHTPIPLLVPRIARKDVNILGYDIAAGTMAIINAWSISRDTAYWEEPEEFKPERFLDSLIDYKGLDFELIPFGAGRRACPGITFAMATNEFVLANILHKFDWESPDGTWGEKFNMSERPGLAIHRAVPLSVVAKCKL